VWSAVVTDEPAGELDEPVGLRGGDDELADLFVAHGANPMPWVRCRSSMSRAGSSSLWAMAAQPVMILPS
jgi:hypothetical protein